MLPGNRFEHALHRRLPPLGVIRRQRLRRIELAPKLAGDDIHFAFDPRELLFRVRDQFGGAYGRVQFQFQLAGELLGSKAPVGIGFRQQSFSRNC